MNYFMNYEKKLKISWEDIEKRSFLFQNLIEKLEKNQ